MVDCGQLDNPVNGFVETLLSTTFGSIVEYGCNFGFLPIGNLVRTCQSNGQWSGSEPTCVPSGNNYYYSIQDKISIVITSIILYYY